MTLQPGMSEASIPFVTAADTLREPDERKRLSGPALRLFFNVADLWDLSVDQGRALLGDISKATYHGWKAGSAGALGRDQIERISYVLGVLKALRLLFADDSAGLRWLRAANSDLPFLGQSPLERMTAGAITDLAAVRAYLDAWRGTR